MSVFIDDLMPQEDKISIVQRLRLSGNRFHLPTFVTKFCQLLTCFPTWTGLMQKLFEHHEDVGTSARSETYFCQIKQDLLPKGFTPKRLDRFLVQHCRAVNARIIKAFARIDELLPTPKPSRSMHPENLDHITAFENWRNRGSKPIPIEVDADIKQPVTTQNGE